MTSKKQSGLSSLKSSIRRKTWLVPSTPAKPATTPLLKKETSIIRSVRKPTVDSMDNKRPSPKSLRKLMSLIPTKEPDKDQIFASMKAESSRVAPSSSRTPKASRTPLRTPNLVIISTPLEISWCCSSEYIIPVLTGIMFFPNCRELQRVCPSVLELPLDQRIGAIYSTFLMISVHLVIKLSRGIISIIY